MHNFVDNLNYSNLLPGQGGLLVVHFDIGTILPSMEPLLHWDTLWKKIANNNKNHILIIKISVKYEIDTLSYELNSVSKWMSLINDSCTTISGHSIVNYINIFNKTEVLTVILRCLMCLNVNWFKSYDTKCKYFYF